jgi:PAS domain S-box-containing protein
VDAMTAYRSVEYFQLQAAGAKPSYLMPVNYGIDFYGDVLFTSKRMIDKSPETVEKFKNASFKGWEYAMTHKEELVDYILTLPGVAERKVSRESLLAESDAMDELVLSQIVEPGHMNAGRWQHILDVHKQLGLVKNYVDINNFIYKKPTSNFEALKSISTYLLVTVGIVFLLIILYSLSVRKAVRRRTAELETQIKERISIQNELRKNEEQLNLIYNRVVDNIFVIDVTGADVYTVTSVNQSFLDTTGLSRDQVIGKRVEEIVPEPSLTLVKAKYAEAIKTKKTVHWEEVTPYPTGVKTGNVSVTPIFDSLNNCVQLIGSVHDITERKHFEKEQEKRSQERELLVQELTKTNKELKQFSFITSHNLRAPLTNLLAIADLIDPSKIEDEGTRDLIDGYKSSTNKLNETLNDLIKILVIKENTNHGLSNVRFSEVYEQVHSSITSIIAVSRAEIETDFTACDGIFYNHLYLESIFLNMITNSIKYAHPDRKPHIQIRSSVENKIIKLSFEDNGIGLDMKTAKERLFGLYQRFHDHPDSKGIGLYLVYSQVTSLGGTIDTESEVGKGTKFTISFK